MTVTGPQERFVGIQISPISFIDEGVEAVLDTLQQRVGVNAPMLGHRYRSGAAATIARLRGPRCRAVPHGRLSRACDARSQR